MLTYSESINQLFESYSGGWSSRLGDRNGAELIEAVAALPERVAQISISKNHLRQIGIVEEVGKLLIALDRHFVMNGLQTPNLTGSQIV